MQHDRLDLFFLRLGVSLVFLYAAIAAFLNPFSWIGFFPQFLQDILPMGVLLTLFGVYQIVLAFWIFSGWKSFYSGILATVTLGAIVISNIILFDIVFRDIAIFFAAVALTISGRNEGGDMR